MSENTYFGFLCEWKCREINIVDWQELFAFPPFQPESIVLLPSDTLCWFWCAILHGFHLDSNPWGEPSLSHCGRLSLTLFGALRMSLLSAKEIIVLLLSLTMSLDFYFFFLYALLLHEMDLMEEREINIECCSSQDPSVTCTFLSLSPNSAFYSHCTLRSTRPHAEFQDLFWPDPGWAVAGT